MAEDHRLTNKRALVTGGSKGIGRSVALALAEAGADVVVSARTLPDLEAVAAEIEGLGRRALALTCDVTDPAQIRQMAETVLAEWGGVDILVNNAGNAQSHKFITHPDELWQQMLDLNLTSAYYVTKTFAPGMVKRQKETIIVIIVSFCMGMGFVMGCLIYAGNGHFGDRVRPVVYVG